MPAESIRTNFGFHIEYVDRENRVLRSRRLSAYERFAGHLAKIKTRSPIRNQRNFRGRIVGLADSQVVFDDKTSGQVRIPFTDIAKANLEVDVDEEFRLAREREATDRHLIKQQ